MKTDPLQQSHGPEYIAEFLGTACLVFFGLSAVVFDFGAGLPMAHWIPNHSARLLITGLCFAGTGSLVALSPLGRLSGGHINPSVSLAFWLSGKMHGRDFAGYVAAQMLGGIFVSSPRLMRWTPLMNWLVIATMVWLEAPVSGTSLNPARSFGPALMTGLWTAQWLYLIAPPLGGMMGLLAFRTLTSETRALLTGKLFTAANYRSIFKPGGVRP
jgi:aquaporin Z